MTDYQSHVYTVGRFAEACYVTTATVRRWIARGRMVSTKQDRRHLIDLQDDTNRQFFRDELSKISQRSARALRPGEIRQFSDRHEVLDEIAWLFKTCYSQQDDIKRKRFRLDLMFANYLRTPKPLTLPKLARVFDRDASKRRRRITDDLKRGWYNELAYQYPRRPSTLTMSFGDMELNKPVSSTRLAFPSWRVTQAYYSTYFYLRAVCLLKTDRFRLEEHNATVSTFKHSVQKPLERLVWKFPLSITYEPGARVDRSQLLVSKLDHLSRAYARYPRDQRTPREVFDGVLSTFQRAGRKGKQASSYTVFDYLRDFRVWANYQNIDDLLNLYGTGYKAFLDQNLTMILFFIGGASELSYMACFTPDAYVRQLQSLYDLFASNNEELKRDFASTPLMQRLAIYQRLGLVTAGVTLKQEEDVNAVAVF